MRTTENKVEVMHTRWGEGGARKTTMRPEKMMMRFGRRHHDKNNDKVG
jgi:hypothetical protein